MIGNHKIVSLCISRLQDNSSYEFTAALNEKLSPLGYSLFVYNTCCSLDNDTSTPKGQASVFELIDYKKTDVLIVYSEKLRSNTITDSLINSAKKAEIPVIVIEGNRTDCISINFDNAVGFEMVAKHIVEIHNAKKLHFIAGGKGNFFSEQRLNVFRMILKKNQIEFNENMISYCDFSPLPAAKATEKLIADGELPEAIICANDSMAIAVIGVLNKYGIKVPEEVIVTGFDGIEDINFFTPRLTSVLCSFTALAEKTAEIVPKIINRETVEKNILIKPELLINNSCGCSGSCKINTAEYLSLINHRLSRFQKENLELSEISAKMQSCDNFRQISALFDDRLMYDMCCLLNKECIDESVNPAECTEINNDDYMFLLYDNDGSSPFVPRRFSTKNIIPQLDYCMERGRIFIFTALQYLDAPMGYVCFHFSSCDFENFMKIPQTINTLNNAIGGYRNLRHEHFLMEKINKMSSTDYLTGLLNRRGFDSELEKIIKQNKQPLDLTIIMADLDGLKKINDNFGHNEGDEAIRAAANALMYACPKNSLCTRFGGDEMFAVCIGINDKEIIKSNLKKYLDNYNQSSGKAYTVSLSIGITYADSSMELCFEEMLRKSDKLMYDEKKKQKRM